MTIFKLFRQALAEAKRLNAGRQGIGSRRAWPKVVLCSMPRTRPGIVQVIKLDRHRSDPIHFLRTTHIPRRNQEIGWPI